MDILKTEKKIRMPFTYRFKGHFLKVKGKVKMIKLTIISSHSKKRKIFHSTLVFIETSSVELVATMLHSTKYYSQLTDFNVTTRMGWRWLPIKLIIQWLLPVNSEEVSRKTSDTFWSHKAFITQEKALYTRVRDYYIVLYWWGYHCCPNTLRPFQDLLCSPKFKSWQLFFPHKNDDTTK